MVTLFTNVDHKRNSKGFNYIANRLRKIAQEYATGSKAMTFNVANIHDFRDLMDSDYSFNLDEIDVKKTYVGIRDDKGEFFYQMNNEFSFDALKKFIQDYHRGVLEGHEKVRSLVPQVYCRNCALNPTRLCPYYRRLQLQEEKKEEMRCMHQIVP